MSIRRVNNFPNASCSPHSLLLFSLDKSGNQAQTLGFLFKKRVRLPVRQLPSNALNRTTWTLSRLHNITPMKVPGIILCRVFHKEVLIDGSLVMHPCPMAGISSGTRTATIISTILNGALLRRRTSATRLPLDTLQRPVKSTSKNFRTTQFLVDCPLIMRS